MFSFYEINAMTIIIIFITAIVVYTILDKNMKNKNTPLYVTGSVLSGVLLSIIISYITIESDALLTENYWD